MSTIWTEKTIRTKESSRTSTENINYNINHTTSINYNEDQHKNHINQKMFTA